MEESHEALRAKRTCSLATHIALPKLACPSVWCLSNMRAVSDGDADLESVNENGLGVGACPHMWNGPRGKSFFSQFPTLGRCGHMSGLCARHNMAAGLDEIRGTGSQIKFTRLSTLGAVASLVSGFRPRGSLPVIAPCPLPPCAGQTVLADTASPR